MEEANFVLLWKEHYEKIEQSLSINKQLLRETINTKAKRSMNSLVVTKRTGVIVGVIYLFFLGLALSIAISNYSSAANYFIVSVTAIFVINLRAVYDYIKHLIWASNIDYDGSVTEIQSKLTKLQLSIFQHSRIMVLQFPFFTTFFLSSKWFPQEVGVGYFLFQIILTGGSVFASCWLYKNQRLENAHKKWLKRLIAGSGGKAVAKAIAFYEEMGEFRGRQETLGDRS